MAKKSKKPVKKAAKKPVKKMVKPAPQKKPSAKKPVAKAKIAAQKKPVARKPAAQKKAVVARQPAAKKSIAKKAPVAKRPAAPKAKPVVAQKKPAATPKKRVVAKAVIASPTKKLPPPSNYSIAQMRAPAKLKKAKKEKKLNARELKKYRQSLLNLRDQVVDGISFLSGDNLNRSQRDVSGDLSGYSLHMADQGTDNYDREFALNLVSSEQDLLYEIDAAIRRIDDGKYGVCEQNEEQIERARLDVVPYARFSVQAQTEMEKGRTRYRPFGPTLSQGS